jgi:AAA domain/DnaB-like helicase N terminal domain
MTRQASATAMAPELPNNIEAERAILGSILMHNPALETVYDDIIPSDFFQVTHQRIYQTMLKVHEDEKPIDTIHLAEYLEKDRALELAGGVPYIEALQDGRPAIGNIGHYAAIVRDKSRLRKLIHQTEFVQKRAWEGSATIDSLEEQFRSAIETQEITHTNGNGNGHVGSSLLDFLKMDFPPQEHLIEGLIPRGASVMIVALPHRMKSFFTTGLALAASVASDKAMGKLVVPKPVRTMLVQVEDPEEIVQKRIRDFMTATQFMNCDPANVWVVKRKDFTGFTPQWCKRLVKQAVEFKADIIVLDVLRRIFEGHGDLNSPTDTSKFLEMIDAIRDVTGAAVVLVHHENKKDADLMNAAAGSYNFPGWANVMIQFKRKTVTGMVSHVEIEVDNKLGPSAEPMRMILDLASPYPVTLQCLEDGEGLADAIEQMDTEWNIRTLIEVMGISRTSAQRRVKEWLNRGLIRKVSGGKKGRGGLAFYSAAVFGE